MPIHFVTVKVTSGVTPQPLRRVIEDEMDVIGRSHEERAAVSGSVVARDLSASPVRCLVIDADPADRRLLADLLTDTKALVVGTAAHVANAGAVLATLRPDVVFLDVRMPLHHLSAMAEAALAAGCLVVAVSAMPGDAVLGFRLNAVDFLLKPYSRAVIRPAMTRIRDRMQELASHASGEPAFRAEDAARLAVAVDGGVEYVPLGAIEWIAAVGYGASVHTAERTIATRTSFTTILRWANEWAFLRTHRGTVVNRGSVRRLDTRPGGTGMLTLCSGHTLPVAKRRLSAVRRALQRAVATPAPPRARRRA